MSIMGRKRNVDVDPRGGIYHRPYRTPEFAPDPRTVVLERIAAALERLADQAQAPVPEPAPVEEGCPHPDDARVDLSTPGDPGHWVCAICRYDSRAVLDTMTP